MLQEDLSEIIYRRRFRFTAYIKATLHMKTSLFLAILVALLLGTVYFPSLEAQTNAPPPASAPGGAPPPSSAPQRSAADLQKLVEPIALHPDPLIAVLLPASVYPLEIVQAARFAKDTNNLAKIDEQPWDENVKAVAKFPELIAKMDADLPWTVELGQAFLDQRKELMDAIQFLRGKAQKAGTLQTSSQQVVIVTNVVVMQTNMTQVVTVTNQVVQVQPSNPEVIYVPSYPPTVYYPPPSYVYNPVAPLVSFGVGMAWGAVLANNCDWGHGDVDIDIDHNYNRDVNRDVNRTSNRNQNVNRTSTQSGKQKWQPDQSRLNKSGAASATGTSREARGWGSSGSGTRPNTGTVGSRPTTGTAGSRPTTGTASSRPTTGTGASGARPSDSTRSAASQSRPSSSPSSSPARSPSSSSVNRGSSGGSAFGGVSSGSSARGQSSRGSASRGGGGGGGRGRR
jgi:hypothetical protein